MNLYPVVPGAAAFFFVGTGCPGRIGLTGVAGTAPLPGGTTDEKSLCTDFAPGNTGGGGTRGDLTPGAGWFL